MSAPPASRLPSRGMSLRIPRVSVPPIDCQGVEWMPSAAPTRLAGRCRVALLATLLFAAPAAGQTPLHERIDRFIEAGQKDAAKPALADDAEFMRRGSLDRTGVIPSG